MNILVSEMARVLASLAVMAAWGADGHCPVRELPSTLGGGMPPMSTDGGFYLTVSGNPEHYEPGALYTVSLRVRFLYRVAQKSGPQVA